MSSIPCPFVYSTGKACAGHIVRMEAYKAELVWELGNDGRWEFHFEPRSHYHLFCSEKGNHAGSLRPDSPQMKFHGRQLPPELRELLVATSVTPPRASGS